MMRSMKEYISDSGQYTDALNQIAGKPQKLTVCEGFLYWTQGKQQELFSVPITAGDVASATPQRVIQHASAENSSKPLTKEEELLRERTRSQVSGISSFRVRESDGAVFFISGVDLYLYHTSGPRAGGAPLKVFDYMSEADKSHFKAAGGKPNMCVQHVDSASNALTSVTFVNSDNIYLAVINETEGAAAQPLTVSIQQITKIGDPKHQCGIADYIIQEEFSRYTGHYANDKYIVFSYTDVSKMREVSLLSGKGDALDESNPEGIERMPYPRVGDANSLTTLAVYERETGTLRIVPRTAIERVAPWVEYIPRFGFKSQFAKGSSEVIYFSVLSRTQEEYAVLSCCISELPTITEAQLQHVYDNDRDTQSVEGIESLTPNVEWEQAVPWAWVEVIPDSPIIFGETHDLLLRHAAETPTGHYHLYTRPITNGKVGSWSPLTTGAWNVKPGTVKIQKGLVSFIANAIDRLSSTLYTVPLPTSDGAVAPYNAAQLTPVSQAGEHVYTYCIAGAGSFAYTASTPTQPAQLHMTNASGRHSIQLPAWIKGADQLKMGLTKAGDSFSYTFLDLPVVLPHVVTVNNRRGVPLSAHIFVSPKQAAAGAGAPGPLAVFVYGGPHVQLVSAFDFDACCKANVQVLLKHGISVAVVDNQMSNANGLRDMSICKKNMGSFETDDYVDVVRYLCGGQHAAAKKLQDSGFAVDPARVAIFGWSYGGYATLLAMSQAPDTFKIGFAGAPVGDWKLYDTGYTERYMGVLYEDGGKAGPDGKKKVSGAYMKSTIGQFASGFPDEINRVYIAHGLLDENVHFENSSHIVNAMIQQGKPYNMLVYPGERHGLVQNKASRLHHSALLTKTLVELL